VPGTKPSSRKSKRDELGSTPSKRGDLRERRTVNQQSDSEEAFRRGRSGAPRANLERSVVKETSGLPMLRWLGGGGGK